ncbi:hypothetical protein L227DRAFT_30241 [Lentinus tigrinus ALCF2SS1-6]|uniref:Uncharacterized protein n=1 Tax=Lentinus tigrinus ALCF2SS1-6 TaxID=1328759 RepID=A0A5C2SLC3_9APHY|nr:hypothetical protein L227DRAFT_30241 [Lentinus tigrinus ALCF2SS1-6]
MLSSITSSPSAWRCRNRACRHGRPMRPSPLPTSLPHKPRAGATARGRPKIRRCSPSHGRLDAPMTARRLSQTAAGSCVVGLRLLVRAGSEMSFASAADAQTVA